jgi:F420-non-reducing hydrogenase iron-sulfur subunit
MDFEPKITAFVCNWCTYAGADLTGTSRIKYATNVRIVRFPCTGCHPNDCHYTSGNFHARRRWIVYRSLLDFMGFDIRRICFSWVSAAEGAKWAELVNETVKEIKELGPYSDYQKLIPEYLFAGVDHD